MLFRSGNEGPDEYNENTIKGYVGESKGIKQILIERGLWIKGMRGSQDAKQRKNVSRRKGFISLDAPLVLSKCEDLLNEKPYITVLFLNFRVFSFVFSLTILWFWDQIFKNIS